MSQRRIVFNGRFFAQTLTGVQRYGIETLCALDRLLGREPQHLRHTQWQLALPIAATEPPMLEHFEIRVLQFLGGHAWEQLSLAPFARGAYLVNASYSGPLLHRRQLITVHDAGIRAQPQTYAWRYRLFNNLLMSALAPHVDTVMTVSHFSAGELRRHFALERDDIVVGHSGWEHLERGPGADTGRDADVLRRHGLASRGYLLAVGSPKASKNFGLIPRALHALGDHATLPVAVAGATAGPVYNGIEPLAGSGAVRLLGFVPDDDLPALYRHAAWFIFPSLYEGFGLPALEAMACGCPVLAARAASIPEVCGDAALYFDPHDAASLATQMRMVAADHDGRLRQKFVQRAQARLLLHRWDANARVLLDRLIAAGAVGRAEMPAAALRPAA